MKVNINKRVLEPVVLFGAAFLVWMGGSEFDAFETSVEFMESHESWELDELFLGFVTMGIAGYIYAFRFQHQKRKELELRLKAEGDLDWLSRHDSLTRLPNRHYLKQFISRTDDKSTQKRDKRRYGLISIDLDGFKKTNDLVGHTGGDKLLVEVSERIIALTAIKLAFRLGGDEFLAIVDLEKTPNLEGTALALQGKLLEPYVIDGVTNRVGASIGLARYPDDSKSLKGAIHNSDLAMYSAKRTGKDGVVWFEEGMVVASLERSSLEQDLQAAISAKKIRPHYQPLIDLKGGELRGFEALARWNRNGGGLVSPEIFIKVAEDIGAISELSDQVLLQACKDAKSWPDHMVLAFNLSPIQLSDRLIGLRIMNILNEAGLPPHRLEIEITESALIQDMDSATFILKSFQKAGIRVALDDFGTGYSNLSHLSQLYFDRIKIDRSFIANFNRDSKQMKIVKTILSLGDALDLHTTAEGIEEKEQLAILKDMGCNCGQGYYLGKPLDAKQTTEFIMDHLSSTTDPIQLLAASGGE